MGGGGSGQEDPAAVCEHPGLYKSESRAGVGELGERRPHWLLPCPKPPDLVYFNLQYRQAGGQAGITQSVHSQCSNELTHTGAISIYYPKSPHYQCQLPFVAMYWYHQLSKRTHESPKETVIMMCSHLVVRDVPVCIAMQLEQSCLGWLRNRQMTIDRKSSLCCTWKGSMLWMSGQLN